MPMSTLTDPAGPLVTTVESAFETLISEIHGKLNGGMSPEQLALSRSSSPDSTLDSALCQHFINHWLKDDSGGDTGDSRAFPGIAVSRVRDEVRGGFKAAVNLAATSGFPSKCTCKWIRADHATTFKVLSAVSGDGSHLTILLLTPAPKDVSKS